MSYIFDIIRRPFGWLIQWAYSWSHSYIVAILIFAILAKIILFPLGIKQQKNSQKQARLRPKENLVRKKYAGRTDRATQMKMNTELQELYQKENFSPLSGCLPMLVQMLVLLAVYAVIRCPLTYTASLPVIEGVENTADCVKQTVSWMAFENNEETADFVTYKNTGAAERSDEEQATAVTEFYTALQAGKYNYYCEINSIKYILNHQDAFVDFITTHNTAVSRDQALGIIRQFPDLELFPGFNLGTVPSLSSITNKEASLGEKLLLIIPALTLVTAYFGQALSRKFMYQPEGTAEQQSQMKIMNIFMPLFSLFIAFQVPSAVAIYWVVQNVLNPVQQFALSRIFPIPEITPEEMKEAERLYGGKAKKKKSTPANGKKKKSLIYDDDDEYESVTTLNGKSVLTEKEDDESGESLIDKAPLKDKKKGK